MTKVRSDPEINLKYRPSPKKRKRKKPKFSTFSAPDTLRELSYFTFHPDTSTVNLPGSSATPSTVHTTVRVSPGVRLM